jgi:DNA-binding PadR family transcriptional regulator
MSAYELGKATGRHQASLKSVLPKLVAADALRKGSERRSGRDVTVYRFNPEWSEAVHEVLRKTSVGHLSCGGRVVLIGVAGVEAAARLLREEEFREQVAWVVEFEDSALAAAIGLRDDVTASALSSFLPALRRFGLQPEGAMKLSVGRALDQSEVIGWTREILEGPGGSSLPPGSE